MTLTKLMPTVFFRTSFILLFLEILHVLKATEKWKKFKDYLHLRLSQQLKRRLEEVLKGDLDRRDSLKQNFC